MLKDSQNGNTKISPARMVLAIVLSVSMLLAMTPNLAPATGYADDPLPAAGNAAGPDGGVVNPTPTGEGGNGTAAEDSGPALLHKVSFTLPEGYLYGDGTNKFTIQVSSGDSVSPVSIPVVPAVDGDVFYGWRVAEDGGDMVLSPDQIASQPVTSDTEYTAVFEKKPGSDSGNTGNTGTKTKDGRGVTPAAELTASTWAELVSRISSAADGDTIRLLNDITRSGATANTNDLTISKNLTIDGGGNTLNFSTTTINRPGFTLQTTGSARTFTLKNVNIVRTNATTKSLVAVGDVVHDSATATTAVWTVNLENINSYAGAATPVTGLATVVSGTVNLSGTVNWSPSVATYRGITARYVRVLQKANVTMNVGNLTGTATSGSYGAYAIYAYGIEFQQDSHTTLSATNTVLRLIGGGSSYFRALLGATVDLTSRYSGRESSSSDSHAQCIWFGGTGTAAVSSGDTFTVSGAAITGTSHGGANDGDTAGTFNLAAGDTATAGVNLTIIGGGKLIGRSLGLQAAFTSNVPNGKINVDGAGSLLDLESSKGYYHIAATLRFRHFGNQEFNVTNGAEVHVKKLKWETYTPGTNLNLTGNTGNGTSADAYGVNANGNGDVAAIRFGAGANNKFNVSGGGKIYIETEGTGTPLDPDKPGNTNGAAYSGNNGRNVAIEIGNSGFEFNVTGADSIISIRAHNGAAFNAGTNGGASVNVSNGASFYAIGKTASADNGTFKATGNATTFTFDNPRFYDFRNNRSGGGYIFQTAAGSSITSKNSDLAVWEANKNLDGDPYLSLSKIDYVLNGTNFGNIASSNTDIGAAEFARIYRNMTYYSRMSGNNDSPRINSWALAGLTNADKTARAMGQVPEITVEDGVLKNNWRSAWSDELHAIFTRTRAGVNTNVFATSKLDDPIYDKETGVGTLHGTVGYSDGGFLYTGDTFRINQAWRGPKGSATNPGAQWNHPALASDITTTAVTVTDVSPPLPVGLTVSTYFKGSTVPITGIFLPQASESHNPDPAVAIYAKLLRSGQPTSSAVTITDAGIAGSDKTVYATMTPTSPTSTDGGTWRYQLPSGVTLNSGDRIYIVAKDAIGNENPVGDKNVRDAVFSSAPYLTVAQGQSGFTKVINGAAADGSITISDVTQDITYRMTVTMPAVADMASINKVEIIDDLGANLKLKGGDTSNVAVGGAGVPVPDSITYAGKKVTVTYTAAAKMAQLADKVVTIDVIANLDFKAGDPVNPNAENRGEIYLNDEKSGDIVTPPAVKVRGKISGKLFNDNDKDGKISVGDTDRSGNTVTLMKPNAAGTGYETVRTTSTDASGNYSFTGLDPDTTYMIRATKDTDAGFTARQPASDALGSHVDNDGNSYALPIDLTNGGNNLEKTVNAGYTKTSVGTDEFSKKLVKVGGEESNGPITSSTADLEYALVYNVSSSAVGINSIQIQDVMERGLVLKDGAVSNIKVTIKNASGTDITNTIITSANPGAYSYAAGMEADADKMVASYTFGTATTFTALAGATITMTVVANLERISGAWPTSVTNIGRLLVNGDTIITPPEVKNNTGVISGSAFNDADYNAIFNAGDTGIVGMTVNLEQKIGATFVTTKTAVTEDGGRYRFEVPAGTYRVKFPVPYGVSSAGITTKAPPDAGSDGYTTEFAIALGSAAEQQKVANAGYNAKPDPFVWDEIKDSFNKQVKDPTDNTYKNAITTTSYSAILEYKISFTVPAPPGAGNQWAGFSSLKLEDAMGEGLKLADVGSGDWNVQVMVGGTEIPLTNAQKIQSGKNASYTFDAAAIARYLNGLAEGTEVVMYVKAQLERVSGNWPTSVTNRGIISANTPSDNATVDRTVTVAGDPPVIFFKEYPLVVSKTAGSTIMSQAELKAGIQVTSVADYPDWSDSSGPLQPLFTGMTATPAGVTAIDKQNIGVYQVAYTATDSNGKSTTRYRAVVVTDGRYIIDVKPDVKPNGSGSTTDIIIGARDYVIRSASVNGTESQARASSWAEAYTATGAELTASWTGAPAGYLGSGLTVPGTYNITWRVPGYTTTKTIKAIVVNADQVYTPTEKSGQYSIVASDFWKTVPQAAAIATSSNYDALLISEAGVKVYPLVDSLPAIAARLVSSGEVSTGEFRGEANSYKISYAILGLPTHQVQITGLVSDGPALILLVPTPKQVAQGGTYGPSQYMEGVSATDPAGDKHGSANPSDWTSTTITDRVKYGTGSLIGGTFVEGRPVLTTKPGIQMVDYNVTGESGNRAETRRVVVVNDGSYVLGPNDRSNILQAWSFVTLRSQVSTDIKADLLGKSGAKAYDGFTGGTIDLNEDAVYNTGSYAAAVGVYNVTFRANDNPAGTILRNVNAKVVNASKMAISTPSETNTDRYYVYGNNIVLSISSAAAIVAGGNTALLNALDAHADWIVGNGTITPTNTAIDSNGGFKAERGSYTVTVKDAGGNATVSLNVQVGTSGSFPEIRAIPTPLVIPYDPASSATLSNAQIMSGVEVRDNEYASGNWTAWNALDTIQPKVQVNGGTLPSIPLNKASVTKVTYKYTDDSGYPVEVSRAVVVDDTRYKYSGDYILEANSFMIEKSQVSSNAQAQILEKSNAKAWHVDGTTGGAVVTLTTGYRDEAGPYKPVVAVDGHTEVAKTIDAVVLEDSNPKGESGSKGTNGDRYSIKADNFRINLTDAVALQSTSAAIYDAYFAGRSAVASYLRVSATFGFLVGGTPVLESVVKQGSPSTNFKTATLAQGDIYLATFYVNEEPATKVTIEVLLSNANPPRITVPARKIVPTGAAFTEGDWTDSATSATYRGGVSATDAEDGTITDKVTHTYPFPVPIVMPNTTTFYAVTYSVADSDYNTATAGGLVFVGPWNEGPYTIVAHSFAKPVGDVAGTDAEIVASSEAIAIDARQYITVSGITGVVNPNYMKEVPVKVLSDGGWSGKAPGDHAIVLAANDPANVAESNACTFNITGTIGAGGSPTIKFVEYPLIIPQTTYSAIMTAGALKAGMEVTDPEDYGTWNGFGTIGTLQALFTGMTATPSSPIDTHNIGVYGVQYVATDIHGNTDTRTRAVIVTDGRFVWDVTDDGNDDNDIIIGARNFVEKSDAIDGSQGQAIGKSYAKAYDGLGNQKLVEWDYPDHPPGYVKNPPVGDYFIRWKAVGTTYTGSLTKTIKAEIVGADIVYPGDENSSYTISANHFLRNTSQAALMVAGNINTELISAAAVKVYKLVDATPPLENKAAIVLRNGDSTSGTFYEDAKAGTYPITFAIEGLTDHTALINGIVSDGLPPALTVVTPQEVAHNGTYGDAQYRTSVSAIDPDGYKIDATSYSAINITDRVRYGTLTGSAFAEGTPVNTSIPDLYVVGYSVTDDDGNTATARRVVVANDGSYVVGAINILQARSFVTRASSVDIAGDLRNELLNKGRAKAWSSETGTPVSLANSNVTNTGGYTNVARIAPYEVTFTFGTVSKNINAKVVDADVIVEGPATPDPTNTDRYYVYGNNIDLTISEANTIAAGGNSALITALGAHADKVDGSGNITDAAVTIANNGGFSSAPAIYTVQVRDAGSNATANLTATVTNGNGPSIEANPVPLIVSAAAVSGSLTEAQIMQGVRVKDIEDTSDAWTAWNALPATRRVEIVGGGMPTIPANECSVTKVQYKYKDDDGNEAMVTRAIVVTDGRYKYDDKYIIEANSFVIEQGKVNTANQAAQILSMSHAGAWDIEGTTATAIVSPSSSYGTAPDSYTNITIAIGEYSGLTKMIEMRVLDDYMNPSGETGWRGENGNKYSIVAKNFRVNLTDARAWQGEDDPIFSARFTGNARPQSFERLLTSHLEPFGTMPQLVSVVKKGAAGTAFKTATLAEGDIYLATFSVGSAESATTVTIEVRISDGNKPVLTVPVFKQVPTGAAFGDGDWADDPVTAPSYRGGVSANDVEDGPITDKVTYNKPVVTTSPDAFPVTYSVTDIDHNNVTRAGMVLVGSWTPTDGGISYYVHDFTVSVTTAVGNEAEIKTKSEIRVIDMRPSVTVGGIAVVNPNFGKDIPTKVVDDGGYYTKVPGPHAIKFALDDTNPDWAGIRILCTGTIESGTSPTITFTERPLIVTQSAVSHAMTEMEVKAKMEVTDPEDYSAWNNTTGPDQPIFKNPAGTGATGQPYGTSYVLRQGGTAVPYIDTQSIGVYKATYTTTDYHGNKVVRTRAIVVTDGRYIVDPADDIIIGARDFVIEQNDVDGSQIQAKGRSYAEAFNSDGDQIAVTWTARPTGYAAHAPAGIYVFIWQADGRTRTKTINGTVTTKIVDPGTKDSQYALEADNFIRTTVQAQTMVDSGNIAAQLISAGQARVIKLVPSAPNASVGVVRNGDGVTGPFSAKPNAYPIRFGIAGHDINEFKVNINGIVSVGTPPTLAAPTPVEIWIGAAGSKPGTAIDPSAWTEKYLVTASDTEDTTLSVTDVQILPGSDTVDTAKVGLYKITYSVTDSDGNTVTAKRVVVVNDGTYVIGESRILDATSFEIKKEDVITAGALKNAQIKGLSEAVLYDAETGDVVDDTVVRNDGGYTNVANDYNIIIGGVDPAELSGYITKNILGKVVDDTVLIGPEGPDGGGYTYYIGGNDIDRTPSQATALTSSALILGALGAHADKISATGTITDATATIVSVTPVTAGKVLANGDRGIYKVLVRDAGDNIRATFTINVNDGNVPVINAPDSIEIPVDRTNSGNITRGAIMAGVTASDPSGDLTGSIVINPDSAKGEHLPAIPANKPDVYSVTYFVENADGNQAQVTKAVVIMGGPIVGPIKGYYINAGSFMIDKKDVTPSDAKAQILDKSGAKAWNMQGIPVPVAVHETGAYKAVKGEYFPIVGVYGRPDVFKQIQATVKDEPTVVENGDEYSIEANAFRVNLQTAELIKSRFGLSAGNTEYNEQFLNRSAAASYLNVGTTLIKTGTVELVSVLKKGDPSTTFEMATYADGDIFLATFRVGAEPDTKVTVEVLVSDANPPVLTVPEFKQIDVGQPFDENTTSPSYMSGVSASDIEDAVLPPITHDTPVDNSITGAAFEVTYSVTDSDNNTVTGAGTVFVGEWSVISGYAIHAESFTKRLGEVAGTQAEAINYANAKAVDVRRYITAAGVRVNNPNFNKEVSVMVAEFDGYDSKALGDHTIVFAVNDSANLPASNEIRWSTTGTIVTGGLPSLTVPDVKYIDRGQYFDENSTTPSYMSGVTATDDMDGDITSKIIHDIPVNYMINGAYMVTYEVMDSDYNIVTEAGLVLVGYTPGRYAISAENFSKTVGQVTGTNAEMISSANATSICTDRSDPNYGKPGTMTVPDNGGYPSKTVGNFQITFGVTQDAIARKTITATVGTGNMPALTVPGHKHIDNGTPFGEAQYMSGVSATDTEDGTITGRITHNNPVNSSVDGYYAVNYEVTDSDGNTARATTIVTVGGTPIGHYNIWAYNFSKRVSAVLGTTSEMISSAQAKAVCIDPSNPNFGKQVTMTVTGDGGYPARKVGSYNITFDVQGDLGHEKTITATVTGGTAPTLTVPAVRRVAAASAGSFSYMQGVSANDAEDGSLTSKVIYNTPVVLSRAGAYKVTYNITDSDGNTIQKNGVVLVGTGWVVSSGVALYAEDFARRLSAITGTSSEARRLANAMAVNVVDQSSTNFGRYISTAITSLGGYKKASGTYDITFAVAARTSVTKTIRAAISNDTPRTPVTNVTNRTTNTTTTTPAPNVTVPAPAVTVNQPDIPGPTVVTVPAVETPTTDIQPEEPILSAPKLWSLIDLLLVIGSLILGFYLMIVAMRRKEEEETAQTASRGKQIRMWGQLGVIFAIVSVAILLLTQSFEAGSSMRLADIWAILFAAIFGVELLATIGVNSKQNDEWSEERSI